MGVRAHTIKFGKGQMAYVIFDNVVDEFSTKAFRTRSEMCSFVTARELYFFGHDKPRGRAWTWSWLFGTRDTTDKNYNLSSCRLKRAEASVTQLLTGHMITSAAARDLDDVRRFVEIAGHASQNFFKAFNKLHEEWILELGIRKGSIRTTDVQEIADEIVRRVIAGRSSTSQERIFVGRYLSTLALKVKLWGPRRRTICAIIRHELNRGFDK